MKILSNQLKPLFIEAVKAAFPELMEGKEAGGLGFSVEEIFKIVAVAEPRDAAHGDFACSAPFKLAKILGLAPAEIGEAIVAAFPKDFMVGSVEFMPPGFVNLRLSAAYLEESLKQLESGFSVEGEGEGGGSMASSGNGLGLGGREKPVIVDYSSTNAAKHMGVHHLMTTVIGDVIANLLEFMGKEVIRINHLGDWGTNFGKLIYAVEKWGDKKKIHANPNNELTQLYVRFHNEAEKQAENGVEEGQDDLKQEARDIFKSLEEGDEERLELWKWIVAESLSDLEKTFARLGVEFDHIMGESFYLDMADEVIKEGEERGVFVEGEGGALIFEMGEGQVPGLLRKGDGATLYLTRDVATIKYRVETWKPEAILYVVDHAQSLHFKQNFAVARGMGYDGAASLGFATALEHISFGRMNFADRAMSTRKGNVIKAKELLDEAARRAGKLSQDRGSELSGEELEAEAEVAGIASVKYAILSQDRVKDIIFDWNKIITLEGNSAPYLLYSYARANSILKKASEGGGAAFDLSGMPELTDEAELAMVRKMMKFPDVLEGAAAERKPHVICTYLFELCHDFNRFYGAVPVIKADTEIQKRTRLGIVTSFMHQLKAGLAILGVPVLEKM